jgi:hypothetical protein
MATSGGSADRLVIIGITHIIQAFQTRKAANTARQTVDDISNRMATTLSD